jgi:hypothetical protein
MQIVQKTNSSVEWSAGLANVVLTERFPNIQWAISASLAMNAISLTMQFLEAVMPVYSNCPLLAFIGDSICDTACNNAACDM